MVSLHATALSVALLMFLPVAQAQQPSPAGSAPKVDTSPGWPQANGPFGNFAPRKFGVALVSDASQARQVWLSEDRDLGYAKGSASGYASNLARWDGHPGSCSGPIVAQGMVFVTSFRPSGEPRAENLPHLRKLAESKKPLTAEEKQRLQANLRILADDLLLAIDQRTGKTVWKATEEGKGLNRYMGKRQGFCVSPAYYNGTVFSMGTTGLLYAYEAATGRKLWEINIGASHENALELKQQVLAKKVLPGGMGWDSSLTIAEGVLIVPKFNGRPDLGLRGVNVKTGRTLWDVDKVCSCHATPAVWSHADRQYVLTATVSGTLQLLDPQSGRTLWKIDGLGENHFSLSPSAKHVFVNGGSNTPRKEGSTQKYGLLAAYQLSPQAAKLAWKHPDKSELYFSTWMDSCARRFLAVNDGLVFYRAHSLERSLSQLMVLDEATGNVLAKQPNNSPSPLFYPVEDQLLMIRDASHSETELALLTANSKSIQQHGEYWHPPHPNTTAYEVSMEAPIVAGHIYLRTKDGRVACYDLRKSE